jgi:hypothetical protein
VREEPGGAIELKYRFRDGSELLAAVDRRIEYVNQEARWSGSFGGDPLELLRRAEREGYAPDGCGIDWQQAETESLADASERIFRGDVCNCQARIRRDRRDRVVALILRSAC